MSTLPPSHERAARVTEVSVTVADEGDAVLTVTARSPRGESTRSVRARTVTIRHAAQALARHYGLPAAGHDHWSIR